MTAATPSALNFLLASRQSEIASLRNLLHTGQLIGQLSQLIHVLQRERGASNIWLCSTGKLFGAELPQRERDVSRELASMIQLLPRPQNSPLAGNSRLYARIAAALHGLSELEPLRQQVRDRTLSHALAMERFNQIIRQLLNLVFEAADTASDAQVSRALIAMFSFMQGKELAGQERATGSAGFAVGAFSAEQSKHIVALIEAQERCFSTFSQFADAGSLQLWREIAEAEPEVERLRRVACMSSQTGEAGVSRWFQLLSKRLDSMKVVEDRLETTLMQCCRDTIRRAEQADEISDLSSHLQAINSEQGYSLYVAGADWTGGQSVALDAEGVAPQLGRSVLTLIQQQSQRLQAQADELATMRASMNDRKQIDQVKLLLMNLHGYSEEQAWQTLRKMAMNQNKRVVDIANAMLSVASAFDGRSK
ncbi:nitrate- and nitrite sensing domain-containing protein [Erwiniaceae bacterium BAC15a-03b]|uniref:Nitrate- and nitrite sensing domain-containing protein n=1 Tax=Winslowiella arboricola TaxID=2978220 RepID=A0A9J6Q154_9GAMM|nr:nitrate- and nitrite sensing domain-containing protein [Winslowiella arboricola]MCU5774873.1 nitrate- and nitrite sensing domain-containing protein [Winslowiella arboricola]MCU5779975.1 nitrate- and nitrite sensing domain-containing protein [Winslowiella arboricola]